MPRRRRTPTHRPLAVNSSHWRSDGAAKARYPTERDARAAAAYRGTEAGYALSVYQCGFCSGWHMARTRDD
ncbi:MAG: hypothetical protein WCL38_00205 [Actinomycetota bacterium]